MGLVRDGCGQPGLRSLTLTVSQEWADGMNWFFACWWKFRKAKSNFNDVWVDVVKIGLGHLVHETLKVYELSLFFACWLWCNNFTAVLLVRPLAVARRVQWKSVHPCLLRSVWVFSWNWIIRFCWILARCQKPLRSCA